MALTGQEARIAKAEDLLAVAHSLFGGGHYNDCISRAYYAVYHIIVAVLATKAGIARGKWEHRELHVAFLQRFCSKGYLFDANDGKILWELMSARFEADYELAMIRKKDAEKFLREAAALMAKTRKVMDAEGRR